jgi:RNA polymerase sigma-70 factor (ECF subfamily)
LLEIIKKEAYSDEDILFAEKHLLPHLDLIYRCALRLTKNKPDAEDLTQETYFIALKNYGQIKDLSKCKNWLFSILRNLFLKVVNKNKKHQVVDFDAVSNFIYELTNLSDDLLLKELKIKVREVLDKTETRHRLPIELFYFKKLSYIEIAKELDLPIGTVMSRIARAKVHLRKELEGFHLSQNE